MTDYSDFTAQIAEWCNREDWSPTLVGSFVAMANQKFNAELRCSRMINTAINTVTQRCATLPDDWLEFDLVQIASTAVPGGWQPIRYKPRDEFFQMPDTWPSGMPNNWAPFYYTIEGRTMFFGGPPDTIEGTQYQIFYYGEVPVFSDTQDSWLYTKYPSLYLSAALMHAYIHAVGEENTAAMQKQLAEDGIAKLNSEWRFSKASGSRLTRTRTRSFG